MKRLIAAIVLCIPVFASPAADQYRDFGAVQCLSSAGTVKLCNYTSRRRACFVQNNGPNDIYIGFTTSVTSVNGVKVAASGGIWSADVNGGVIVYCRAVTADQVANTSGNAATDTRWQAVSHDSK